ncbi:unnamed protein product [Adineta steineri]|uniref:Methyltransferase domain-containing protein n=1 Tax=Adineta steineri TaxID=433720 RepID=A0A818RK38_9BILA|nr:unnamed protein product [Adineta steineri]
MGVYLKNVHQSSFSTLIKQILFKGQHDVVITKDAFVDITYLGTRLHHYDCLLEGKVSLSNLFYKNSNNYIQKRIGQLISNSSSVLNQCQGDELTIVYGSVLILQIFEQKKCKPAGGAGAAWCVHTHAPHSYIGIDSSQDIINLCQRLYSTTPRLSFVVADATEHLPFENESIDIILCIEATHAFSESITTTQFANEVDVLHALDIQNRSRTDFIQPEEQEYFRRFAGLPGTQIYEDMSQGRSEYW